MDLNLGLSLNQASTQKVLFNKVGLVMWLRADKGYRVDNTIPIWDDQSGAGTYAELAFGNDPIFVANSINGMPALTFNQTAMFFPLGVSLSDASTTFLVFKHTNLAKGTFLWQGTTAYNLFIENNFPKTGYSGNGLTTIPNALTPNTPVIVTLYRPATTGISLWYVNGVVQTPPPASTRALYSNGSDLFIGTEDATPGNTYTGDIAEIIIFNRALPSSRRLEVDTYLKSKYSIA
jgi:hypothetical protein